MNGTGRPHGLGSDKGQGRRRWGDLTIADLEGPSRQPAEELVRVLAGGPAGGEPLAGVLEYAPRAPVTSNVRPVLVPAGAGAG